jgi:NADH dehydrogenase
MATIVRLAAVAKVEWPFKAHFGGFLAWFSWLTVHIYFLIGFRNRLAVLSQWIWSYFTFSYGVRLIYGSQALPGWTDRKGIEMYASDAPGDPMAASPVMSAGRVTATEARESVPSRNAAAD